MSVRDVVSWNTVISSFYQDGNPEKALEFYGWMKCEEVVPNAVTFTTAVASCARLMDLERGREIHRKFMESGFSLDDIVRSALVDIYGRCRSLDTAKDIFEQIRIKNVIAWSAMIAGNSLTGDSKSCIRLLRRMLREGVKPSIITLSSLMAACSRSVQLLHGKFVHGYIYCNSIEADSILTSSLIDLYCKCDRVTSSERIFRNSPADITTFNPMISGYVAAGHYFMTPDVFDEMKAVGVRPHAVTFLAVLSACRHTSLVDEGYSIFNQMVRLHGLEPRSQRYSCVIDLLGRARRLLEAYRILSSATDLNRDVELLSTEAVCMDRRYNCPLRPKQGTTISCFCIAIWKRINSWIVSQ